MERKLCVLLALVVLCSPALSAQQRPISQWAGMVAIGDDIAHVNEALKFAHYPPMECSPAPR